MLQLKIQLNNKLNQIKYKYNKINNKLNQLQLLKKKMNNLHNKLNLKVLDLLYKNILKNLYYSKEGNLILEYGFFYHTILDVISSSKNIL